jgi:hypothetical protein
MKYDAWIGLLMGIVLLIPGAVYAQQVIVYPPVAMPAPGNDASLSMPLGVGDAASGGSTVSLRVDTGQFSSPVDLYFGVMAPAINPEEVFLAGSDGTLRPMSQGIVAWRENVSLVQEAVFPVFEASTLPPGIYSLFLMAVPALRAASAGELAVSTLWQTGFVAGSGALVSTPLSGTQAVPPVQTPATGTGDLALVNATGEITASVTFSGLTSGVVAAHIHMGVAGANGPVIVGFTGPTGVTSGTWSAPPGAVLNPDQLAALQNGGLYFQVHTTTHPGGELRGQIIP